MKSLLVKLSRGVQFELGQVGWVVVGEQRYAVQVQRLKKDEVILGTRFENHLESGKFFDIYRRFAYPALRSRYEFPLSEGIRLYEETGYYDKFQNETDKENITQQTMQTWSDIQSAFHDTTADYFIVDRNHVPVGASSLAHAFFRDEKPVWAMHQLCAKKNPDLLLESGMLYRWRADYLLARSEDLFAFGCFCSRTRWLERMYVKFANNVESDIELDPVVKYWMSFDCEKEGVVSIPSRNIVFGKKNRHILIEDDVLAGVDPGMLNASGMLDTIISAKKKLSEGKLNTLIQSLCSLCSSKAMSLHFMIHYTSKIPENAVADLSDRVFIFSKDSLILFLNSLEHTIRVSFRKYSNVKK